VGSAQQQQAARVNPATRDLWFLVLLGVVALATLVQAVVLVAATIAARRAAERLAVIEVELREHLSQSLVHLQRATDSVTAMAQHATRQSQRVEHLLDATTDGARHAVQMVGGALLPSLKWMTLFKGVMRGIQIYRARRA
jgi:hypothetical protein